MKLYGSWIESDGGPSLLVKIENLIYWKGSSNFKNSQMTGGGIETHYDLACKGNEYIDIIAYNGYEALVLSGDVTTDAWVILDNEIGVIRPIYFEKNEHYNAPSPVFYNNSILSTRLEAALSPGDLAIIKAADFGPKFRQEPRTISLKYFVSSIDTRVYQDDNNHVIFHILKKHRPLLSK